MTGRSLIRTCHFFLPNIHGSRPILSTKLQRQLKNIACTTNKQTQRSLSSQKTSGFLDGVTLRDCWLATENLFQENDIAEPRESAEYLIAHAVGVKTLSTLHPNKQLTTAELGKLHPLIELRLKRMPVQYVLQEWDFRDLVLDLKPPVFIPRPETEELVDHLLNDITCGASGHFLEVGPGSGAICCSILTACSKLTCTAVDSSHEACQLTKQNAVKCGVDDRLNIINKPFHECQMQGANFEFIVSNPPYVKTEDMTSLQREISGFEDPNALHGGEDGLVVIHEILKLAPSILCNDGSVWLEVDSSHPPQIEAVLRSDRENCLRYLCTFEDFSQLPRFCHLKLQKDIDGDLTTSIQIIKKIGKMTDNLSLSRQQEDSLTKI